MNKKIKFFTLLTIATSFMACNTNTPKKEEVPTASKTLVIYYSQTGATAKVAEEIKNQLGAEIDSIVCDIPYDGNFQETIERCQKEMEVGEIPTVKPLNADLDQYDVIFLGYPVWFGTYAPPVEGFIRNQSLKGKKVVTFCTFGSGGLQSSTENLKKALSESEVMEGYGVRNARIGKAAKEINRFLIEEGYKEGEIDLLPAFGVHNAVTSAEVEIFNQACGDYPFPLGTPVDVASREIEEGTEYEFTTKAQEKGKESEFTIYVTVGKEADAKAEFTQVIR